MVVFGSLQQQVAAALYGPLRSFPGLATPAAEAAQCDSERLEVWGLSATLWASAQRGLQLKRTLSMDTSVFRCGSFSFSLVL